jgi:exodeoxyribonuclease V alpha subunit
VLRAWVDAGWLRALDEAFADFVAAPAAGQALFGPSDNFDPLVRLAAAWVSHQAGRGQTGLDLAATLADPTAALDLPPQDGPTRTPAPTPAHQEAAGPVLPLPGDLLAGVTLTTWVAALRAHTAVGEGAGSTPLVLAQERLYLRRHWQCEQSIEQALGQRLQQPLAVDDAALCQALDALFAPSAPPDADEPDWQKIACALAARQAFAIVTGGPGTGKTTTVVKLLAVLQHLALQAGATAPGPLRIRLAAPTGKAAARLAESIAKARDALALDGLPGGSAVRAALPTEVSTLHRLLGVKPGSRHFRHHAQQPLPLDVLVIDEASMVDLEMMAAVLAALPPQARLVLLGDKDQLASVEAGAVLGTLCQRADGGHYTPATRDWVQQVTGQDLGAAMTDPEGRAMDQAIVKLRKSHRFGEGSGIGRLAQAVNAGQDVAARQLLSHGLPDLDLATDLYHLPPRCRPLWQTLQQQRPPSDATPGAYDAWAHQVLKAAARFQVLCAVRGGPQGVEAVNRRIAQALAAEGLIPHAEGWFLGRPVMVTRNDYALGLMNGDAGVTLEGPAGPATPPPLRVAFPDGRGGIRWVPVSRLQAVETVFAMTVHKSQGSEFDHVALVLPTHASPVLTRELVYTAITRARQRFTLALPGQDLGVLAQAIGRQVRLAGTPAA